ncbi:MAG TPA: AAA family ATPase [Chloroflexota bacterium]|nr:AAA family ATPase [Chloroflexota bacterium]
MITLTRLVAAQYKGLVEINLAFPERGSILVEGRNEAGKSTLFDAVHFALYGRPLVGDQADAIHYGADQAVVELGMGVGTTTLNVRRALRQTAKTMRAEAELEVVRSVASGDDEREVVKGAAAVTQRLQQELGGLTSEALLNSCLVAQKQLGRLETLTRSQREEALTILLNLGKLSEVHQRLRIRPDDEEQLRRARARVELARLAADLARIESEQTRLERARQLIELRDALNDLALAETAYADTERQHATFARRLAQLRRRLHALELQRTRVELSALDEVAAALPHRRKALADAQRVRAAAQALTDTRTRLVTLERETERVAERLAERAEMAARCGRLSEELDHLRKQHRDVQAALQQLAPLTAALEASRARQAKLARLQRAVAAARQAEAAVAAQEQRQVRVSELLQRWVEARRVEEQTEQVRRLLDDLALGIAGLEHVTVGKSASAEPGLRLRLLVDHPLIGGLALQLRLWSRGAELVEVRSVTAKEAERLLGSGVPKLSAAGLDEARRDRQAVAAQLLEIGEREPNDLAAGEARLARAGDDAELDRARRDASAQCGQCLADAVALHVPLEEESLDALPEAIADELKREAERQAELSVSAGRREGLQREQLLLERNGKERKRELEECQTSLSRDTEEQLHAQREALGRDVAQTGRALTQLESDLRRSLGDGTLGGDGAADPREAAQRAVDALSGEVAVLERRLDERAALAEHAAVLEEALATSGDAGEHSDAAIDTLDEAQLRAEAQSVERAAGAAEATLTRTAQDRAALAVRSTSIAAALGVETPGETPVGVDLPARLRAALPELASALPSPAEVDARLATIHQERGALERGAREARTLLGEEEPPALEQAEAALHTLEEDVAARRRGQDIVAATRQRMIAKVLPDTLDNMCVLLPMLTAERYRYAELTPDYRLQVWDDRKRAFVEKGLFSGGTQDQFSLALRLGFALAALPRELGTSPGFLFLDEPLSSFDRDRTESLVGLLTRGQIATFFKQVFLISHSQSFDPGLFTHHVVMEHGRVAESTLPAA